MYAPTMPEPIPLAYIEIEQHYDAVIHVDSNEEHHDQINTNSGDIAQDDNVQVGD